ncbi:hypothetical protein LTR50_004386 [Elasticomyces elasticus]|nr:hypothetical protein LTR50_004386 [Elasticomyces elasticus]
MARPMSPPPDTRMLSPSPPPQQPLSKRDKRRANITDKLADMINSFSRDRDQHYRAQMQAVQVDMTLVLRADPYQDTPLNDSAEEVDKAVKEVLGDLPSAGKPHEDFIAMVGREYGRFVEEANAAQETRDVELTQLWDHHEKAKEELKRQHNLKVSVAEREHYELSSTIRNRLITSINARRAELMREKEKLDISDSNAFLLHPNQYTINNPASPGGALSNRKTRHTRHRVGDPDEPENTLKRKRKAAMAEEIDSPGPAPAFRSLQAETARTSSPYHEARAKTQYAQQEAPAYSLERLFTEKELAMATTVAYQAAHNFLVNENLKPANTVRMTNGNAAPSIPSIDGTVDVPSVNGIENVPSISGDSPPPTAQEMERTTSHFTRTTRAANNADPLAALASAAAASAYSDPFAVPPPAIMPITKTNTSAPPPSAISAHEIESDIGLMTGQSTGARAREADGMGDGEVVGGEDNEELQTLRLKLLERACGEGAIGGVTTYRTPNVDLGPAVIKPGSGVVRLAAMGFAAPSQIPIALGGTGGREGASALAALNASGMGGAPMSRTTSLGGFSDVGEAVGIAMKRVRSRLI